MPAGRSRRRNERTRAQAEPSPRRVRPRAARVGWRAVIVPSRTMRCVVSASSRRLRPQRLADFLRLPGYAKSRAVLPDDGAAQRCPRGSASQGVGRDSHTVAGYERRGRPTKQIHHTWTLGFDDPDNRLTALVLHFDVNVDVRICPLKSRNDALQGEIASLIKHRRTVVSSRG
jgi:hypothetical protein